MCVCYLGVYTAIRLALHAIVAVSCGEWETVNADHPHPPPPTERLLKLYRVRRPEFPEGDNKVYKINNNYKRIFFKGSKAGAGACSLGSRRGPECGLWKYLSACLLRLCGEGVEVERENLLQGIKAAGADVIARRSPPLPPRSARSAGCPRVSSGV